MKRTVALLAVVAISLVSSLFLYNNLLQERERADQLSDKVATLSANADMLSSKVLVLESELFTAWADVDELRANNKVLSANRDEWITYARSQADYSTSLKEYAGRINARASELSGKVSVLQARITELKSPKNTPTPNGVSTEQQAIAVGRLIGGYDFGIGTITATGSMLPVLNPSVWMILTTEPVSIGDIAIFDPKDGRGRTVVHRIIGETEDGKWIFQGDNNIRYTGLSIGGDDVSTEIVNKEDVLWRVKAILY